MKWLLKCTGSVGKVKIHFRLYLLGLVVILQYSSVTDFKYCVRERYTSCQGCILSV